MLSHVRYKVRVQGIIFIPFSNVVKILKSVTEVLHNHRLKCTMSSVKFRQTILSQGYCIENLQRSVAKQPGVVLVKYAMSWVVHCGNVASCCSHHDNSFYYVVQLEKDSTAQHRQHSADVEVLRVSHCKL